MDSAVAQAACLAWPGDTVLLAPERRYVGRACDDPARGDPACCGPARRNPARGDPARGIALAASAARPAISG
ncbi:MAG: hypothetical protein ACLP7J_28490 [Streptosporangiaceae bacterium]